MWIPKVQLKARTPRPSENNPYIRKAVTKISEFFHASCHIFVEPLSKHRPLKALDRKLTILHAGAVSFLV